MTDTLKKSSGMNKVKRNKLLFYIAIIAIPLIQFSIFYIYVNFNSILLAFKSYDYDNGQYSWVFFDNIKEVVNDLFHSVMIRKTMANTMLAFALTLIIGTSVPVLVSFYIYKKRFGYKFFRVLLFLPSIISGLAIVLAYKYFVEIVIPYANLEITGNQIEGLLSNPKTSFGTILFYTFWFGTGSSFLLYTSTMSSISDSVIDAAKIDGATPLQEFTHVILPMIYPTYVTFVVANIAVIFSNQINLFSIYGYGAQPSLYTIGYYLYKEVSYANIATFPYLSAFGLVLTVIVTPVCLIVKYLLEKFGPKED